MLFLKWNFIKYCVQSYSQHWTKYDVSTLEMVWPRLSDKLMLYMFDIIIYIKHLGTYKSIIIFN